MMRTPSPNLNEDGFIQQQQRPGLKYNKPQAPPLSTRAEPVVNDLALMQRLSRQMAKNGEYCKFDVSDETYQTKIDIEKVQRLIEEEANLYKQNQI